MTPKSSDIEFWTVKYQKANGPPPPPNPNYAPKSPVISLFDCQASHGHADDLWACHANPLQRGRIITRGGGVISYITYTGICRPKGSWFWSSWFRTGYLFQRRFLERGIIFRTHQSSTFVSSHLKLFKDRLLLKIRLNALTSKSWYSCCPLERWIKNWPISRTGYHF